MTFLKRKISKVSKEAQAACEQVTKRLKNINRQFLEKPPSETLPNGFRARAKAAYDEHLVKCEGISLPLN